MVLHFEKGVIKDSFRFGSFTRGTILPRIMDANSDIDYMIVFSENNATPQTYLNRLKAFVENYYKTSEIYQSKPTIVLELNHIKFDLVPAITTWYEGMQIPNNSGGWMSTNPNDFNTTLEDKNKANNSLIKPTIRLMKYWNATSRYPFDSFEMEKWICNLSFWFLTNQKDYLFKVIDSMGTSYQYAQWINDEISRAKRIVDQVRQYENDEMPSTAEKEVRKLFRL